MANSEVRLVYRKFLVRVCSARDLLKILRDDEPLTDVFLSTLILADVLNRCAAENMLLRHIMFLYT